VRKKLRPGPAVPVAYILLKKVLQNDYFFSCIIVFLEDNEKLWFDLFLRDFSEIFGKRVMISSMQ
jgi:hypothetical protein